MIDKSHLGFAVKALDNQIRRVLHATAPQDEEGGKATGMQNAIIGMLANAEGEVYQRDVEKRFHIRGATASGILKLMEQNGYITRTAVPGDARRKSIALTPDGQARGQKAEEAIRRMEDCMRQGLTEAEQEDFLRIVSIMQKNLEQMEEMKEV